MTTTQTSTPPARRLRAALIGIGFDGGGDDDPKRVTRSAQCLVVGGSEEIHAEMREAVARIEVELESMQRRLCDLDPMDLAELAFRVDLPELHHLAMRMEEGLERQGREFGDLSADELAALLDPDGASAVVGS